MPNSTAWTGNGAAVALTTQSVVFQIISIDGFGEMLPDVDNSDLGTSGHQAFMPGDLLEHDELVFNVIFDPDWIDDTGGDDLDAGETDVLTLTLPIAYGSANTTNATLSGQGWVKGWTVGEIANNQRIEGTLVWRFEGGNASSPITWSEESA